MVNTKAPLYHSSLANALKLTLMRLRLKNDQILYILGLYTMYV